MSHEKDPRKLPVVDEFPLQIVPAEEKPADRDIEQERHIIEELLEEKHPAWKGWIEWGPGGEG